MSREETTTDALIGLLLIVVSFLILLLCAVPLYGVIWVISKAGSFINARIGTTSEFWYLSFLCLVALLRLVSSVRNRCWPHALLFLTAGGIAATILVKYGVWPRDTFWFVPFWLLIGIPDSRRLPLLPISSAVFLLAAGFILNSGPFAHATWARFIDDIAILAMCAWLWFYVFRPQLKSEPENTPALRA